MNASKHKVGPENNGSKVVQQEKQVALQPNEQLWLQIGSPELLLQPAKLIGNPIL